MALTPARVNAQRRANGLPPLPASAFPKGKSRPVSLSLPGLGGYTYRPLPPDATVSPGLVSRPDEGTRFRPPAAKPRLAAKKAPKPSGRATRPPRPVRSSSVLQAAVPAAVAAAPPVSNVSSSINTAIRNSGPPRISIDRAVDPVAVRTGATGKSAAQQIVDAALAPLLASLKQQEGSLSTRQTQQQEALRGFTAELMRYLGGVPGAVSADYQQAIDTTDRLAQTAATGLLNANPNAQTQADLAAINAPQAQRDALAALNQQVFGGGAATLYKTAGAIPATGLAGNQAAARAFADSLPGVQTLAATQAFQRLLASQAQDSAKIDAQRAEINAKRPGLLADANKQLAGSTLTRGEATDISIIWSENKKRGLSDAEAQAQVNSYLSTIGKPGAYDWSVGPPSFQTKPQAPKKTPSYADPRNPNYYTDANGNRVKVGYRLNKNGVPVRISTKNQSNKPLTALQVTKLKGTAATIAENAYRGFSTVDKNGVETAHPPIGYQDAINEGYKEGIPLRIMLQQLNRFYKRGERGRPKVGYYERKKARG